MADQGVIGKRIRKKPKYLREAEEDGEQGTSLVVVLYFHLSHLSLNRQYILSNISSVQLLLPRNRRSAELKPITL